MNKSLDVLLFQFSLFLIIPLQLPFCVFQFLVFPVIYEIHSRMDSLRAETQVRERCGIIGFYYGQNLAQQLRRRLKSLYT